MDLSRDQIAQLIDISAVKADSRIDEVAAIVRAAQQYNFFGIFTLPSMAAIAKDYLGGETKILLGSTVGFPSGGSTTAAKVFEAEELLKIGCDELDMVINIGKLKSNLYKDVAADIQKVVEVAGKVPVKVILEVSLLTDKEIFDGAKIIRDSGARFVKTGTGWQGATSLEHIRLIIEAVNDSIRLKVAGGVRSLEHLLRMHEMGVARFGIGYTSAINIMEEFDKNSPKN